MMAGFQFFERDLKLATAGMEPDAIDKALAAFAKQELKRVIGEGIASPTYERYVNGVHNAPEEAVKAPGPIVYEFVNWPLIVTTVLAELQKRSPRRSGRFASSFIVIAGGAIVSDFSAIPAAAEVIITNFQPYIRKVEGGLSGVKRRRVFDGTKSSMAYRYRDSFSFETRFLNIGGGVHPAMPYILKGGAPLRAAVQSNRSSAFRAGRATLARRKDREAGMPITYPSIIINAL
ncbi:hypothetical protein [Mesorhizobium ventifaucium]|uniref:Uncharacterized protein n=1 Tax=Mesorhizobium ventifaucium TaxID=666020 RepID=A0ABN8JNY3_9HYPH|nr:hypothetical protein [Mesorhizobium ventifaucium]CAH2399228.1 conserved hypothetical protein [Mesorhizobium ventifaucium]